jgi:hypothetical protein
MGSDMHMMTREERIGLSVSSRMSTINEKIREYARQYNQGSQSKSMFVGGHWLSKNDRGKSSLPLEICVFYCMTMDKLKRIIEFDQNYDINFTTCKNSQFLEAMTLNFGNFSFKIKKDKVKFRVNRGSDFNTSAIGEFYFANPSTRPDIVKNHEWQKFDLNLFLSRVNEISTR